MAYIMGGVLAFSFYLWEEFLPQKAIAVRKAKCGSEGEEHRRIGQWYQAYHSATAGHHFDKRGILGQYFKTGPESCRTVDRMFNEFNTGDLIQYKPMYYLGIKPWESG